MNNTMTLTGNYEAKYGDVLNGTLTGNFKNAAADVANVTQN